MTSQYLYFKDCAPSQAMSSALTAVNAPGQLESVPYLSAAVTSQPRVGPAEYAATVCPCSLEHPIRHCVPDNERRSQNSSVLGNLVQTTAGTWITRPPPHDLDVPHMRRVRGAAQHALQDA
jgi:hypothetical protein